MKFSRRFFVLTLAITFFSLACFHFFQTVTALSETLAYQEFPEDVPPHFTTGLNG